jgi:hypothetical protein
MSPPSVLAAPAASTLPAQDTVPFSPAAGTVAPPSPLPAAAAGSGVGRGGALRIIASNYPHTPTPVRAPHASQLYARCFL